MLQCQFPRTMMKSLQANFLKLQQVFINLNQPMPKVPNSYKTVYVVRLEGYCVPFYFEHYNHHGPGYCF